MMYQKKLKSLLVNPTCILCLLFTFLSQNNFAASTSVILQSGDQAPGGNGQFSGFLGPKINNSNNIVFFAELSNTSGDNIDDTGLYRTLIPASTVNGPAVVTLEELARENDFFSASGISFHLADLTQLFSSTAVVQNAPFNSAVLAAGDGNNVALMLPLMTNSGDFGDSIIVVESGNSFTLVAEAGDVVESGNGEYREFGGSNLKSISPNNDVTFFSALDNTEDDTEDNTALFKRFNNNSIVEIIRKGDSVASGDLFHFGYWDVNDLGASVFSGTNFSSNQYANTGIYKGSSTAFSLVAHEGDLAPTDDEAEDNRIFAQMSKVHINNDEEIGFTAFLLDENEISFANNSGVFVADDTSMKMILREAQETPDGTAIFRGFLGPFSPHPNLSFNDSAEFAAKLEILVGGDHSEGIFKFSETELMEIARRDDPYEGGYLRFFSDPAINNQGLVVFKTELVTGEEIGDEGPVFITDEILIVSDGTHYETIDREGRDHDGKIVSRIGFNENGFNDAGIVAYIVYYDDGTSAILAWVPQVGWRPSTPHGEWDDLPNWHFSGVPHILTDVVFNSDQEIDLQGPSEATAINSLSLGGTVQFTLSGSTFTVTQGTVILAPAILTGQGTFASSVQNDGQIEVLENQSLHISGETTNNSLVILNPGSELSFSSLFIGNQTIQGTGTITFNGGLQLGDEPELLISEGNVNFGDTSVIQVKVNGLERGVSYDAMDAAATVTLGGILEIQIPEALSLSDGDTFQLINANQILGEFSEVIFPTLQDETLQLSINRTTTTSVELVVSQESTVTPAPAPAPKKKSGGGSIDLFSVLFLLMAMVAYRGRRRFRCCEGQGK